jgi:hypothetical protein
MTSSTPEGRIFLSYRREDTSGYAGRLFDHLKRHFGKDRVFMDISNIEPGVDFVESIEKALGSCDAFLVLIGKNWLDCRNTSGERRLDNPDDFIRIETSTALKRDVRVFPILVKGAEMPSSKDLPEDMVSLARRNAQELSDQRWDFDCNQLLQVLETIVGPPYVPEPSPEKKDDNKFVPPPPKKNTWLIGGLAIAGIVGALLLASMLEESQDNGGYIQPQPEPARQDPVAKQQPLMGRSQIEEPQRDRPEVIQPPPVRPEPEPVQPQTMPVSVTGSWQGSDGMIYMVEQSGDYIEVYGLNDFGVVMMTGEGGFIDSGTLGFEYDLMDGTYGESTLEVAPNGQLMSGTFTNHGTGLYGVISLTRLE